MCRISGILRYNETASIDLESTGVKMRDSMAYGGPDDKGEFINMQDGIFLGHRRLSVIDTSAAGHQPMFNGNKVLVFNGEIYNYAAISEKLTALGYQFNSHSDSEVLLRAFDCWGYDAVQQFHGMFAFALWDKEEKKLLLCRDRVGVKPVYWYQKDGIFLFGSELKSLREFPGFDTTINQEAVSLFLQTGYIKSPHSIFKYAHKLEPGSFLEIDIHGSMRTWKYWEVNDIQPTTRSYTDASVLEEAEDLLVTSCQYRMVADVPVGIFLSGGIDSSLITALLQKDSGSSLKTFTIGFENTEFDESRHARKVAEHIGTDHQEFVCTKDDFRKVIPLLPDMYDEPFGDSSAIPTHIVSVMARKQVTVALSADGGDEVFSGYNKYISTGRHWNRIKHFPLAIRRQLANVLSQTDHKKIKWALDRLGINYDLATLEWRIPKLSNALNATDQLNFFELASSYIAKKELQGLHRYPAKGIIEKFPEGPKGDHLYALLGKIDIATYLEGDILTKVDRASMAVALEGREPLLDHKLIEFGLSLPDKYKIRNGETKWLLRNVLYKHVPKQLIERPKQGFAIPVKEWLNSELKDQVLAMKADDAFADLFSLDKAELSKIIDRFFYPGNTTVDPHFVWFLYSLYMWYKRWM